LVRFSATSTTALMTGTTMGGNGVVLHNMTPKEL